MKVFVTGATGYIGSHAVVSFLSQGLTVVGLDNLSNSSDCSERIEKISGGNFEFIKGNINAIKKRWHESAYTVTQNGRR